MPSALLRQHTILMSVKFVTRMDTDSPMGYPATTREFQERAFEEEHWTTDEDAIDSVGPTRVPNSPAVRHDQERTRIPSEQARNAAAAVMRTNSPRMLAEMNPDWDPFPLTEPGLLHRSEDTSDSAEMVPSEEYWTSEDSDSEGFLTFNESLLFQPV